MYSINSGEFREKIIIKRLIKSSSSLIDDSYKNICTKRCKVKGLGGNEFLSNDSIQGKQTYNFIIRSSKIIDIKYNDIIFFKNKNFDIQYINLDDPRYIELKGVEI